MRCVNGDQRFRPEAGEVESNTFRTAPYLDGKPEGDRSMVSKRAGSKMCRVVRPASPACKVRLGMSNPRPSVAFPWPSVAHLRRRHRTWQGDATTLPKIQRWGLAIAGKALYDELRVVNPILVKRTPQKHAERLGRWKRGMAYKARASWSRSHRSSLRAGKPLTWRRVAGTAERRNGKHA